MSKRELETIARYMILLFAAALLFTEYFLGKQYLDHHLNSFV